MLSRFLTDREHIGSSIIIHAFIWLLTILLTLVMSTLIERSDLPRQMYFHGYLWLGIAASLLNALLFYWLYFYLARIKKSTTRKSILFHFSLVMILAVSVSTVADITLFSVNFEINKYAFVWYFILFNLVVKFYFCLMAIFTRFSVDWVEQVSLRNATQLALQETELAFLKSQTNPHFLFNTLNALYSSSYQFGDTQTARGIDSLSHLLRYMLLNNSKKQVKLEQEIEHIESYIFLQKQRHQTNLKVEFTRLSNMPDIQLAPMLLMPLVENAFKYGLRPNCENEIMFNISCSNSTLTFISRNVDHSALYKNKVTNDGFGLGNLKKRLGILYPQQYQFSTSTKNGYFNAKLEIKCA